MNEYTLDEVQKHNNPDSCWIIINGNVYDITEFIANHPGGEIITKACGTDATNLFYNKDQKHHDHLEGDIDKLKPFLIGKLKK